MRMPLPGIPRRPHPRSTKRHTMHNHGLGAWMARRRLKSPDKVALIHGDGDTVTYRQLADGTDRVSSLLWSRGIRKGDRVAFLGENSPEFLQVLFGAAQLGAVFV